MSKDIYKEWQKCQQNIRSKLGPRPNNFNQIRFNEVDILDLQPADIIAIDWCKPGSKNYLIMVDYSSGYLWAKQSAHKTTKICLKLLKGLFATIGYPKILISDNTGEFRQSFTDGLGVMGVKHSTSRPLNSQVNGRAEQAVQRFKINLSKNKPKTNLQLQLSLLQLNQVFSSDKNIYSPFIQFFKR